MFPLCFQGTFTTIKMKPSKIGTWLLETEVGEYQERGMKALFTVIDKGTVTEFNHTNFTRHISFTTSLCYRKKGWEPILRSQGCFFFFFWIACR